MKAFIKEIWAWLKAIYIKPVTAPAAAESQTPEVKPVTLSLNILTNSQPADGVSANTVQAFLTDGAGNIVPGAVVNFSVTSGAVTPAQGTTDAGGQVVASVTGTLEGPVTLSAILADGTRASVNTLYFVAVPAAVDAATTLPTNGETVISPLDAAKAKFEAFVAFVEHGINVLGADAEAELVAMKDKYL